MNSEPTWRITAMVNFPLGIDAATPPAPGSVFPQSLKVTSRVPQEMSQDIRGVLVTLGPWYDTKPNLQLGMQYEPAALTFTTTAEASEVALSKIESLMELVIDDLSFQLQTAVHILELEVLDISPPLAVGMERQCMLFPFPSGYTYPKFSQSVALGNEITATTPILLSDYSLENEKVRAALRWYVKGLATPFEADKFTFYWIAVEILSSLSNTEVEKPYSPRCGHEIPECPVCGTKTSKQVFGETIKSFLITRLNLSGKAAKDLWRMRQMLHGANHLTQRATTELPRLVQLIRYAALRALKEGLAINQEDLPTLIPEATAIAPGVGFIGTRAIAEKDLP